MLDKLGLARVSNIVSLHELMYVYTYLCSREVELQKSVDDFCLLANLGAELGRPDGLRREVLEEGDINLGKTILWTIHPENAKMNVV